MAVLFKEFSKIMTTDGHTQARLRIAKKKQTISGHAWHVSSSLLHLLGAGCPSWIKEITITRMQKMTALAWPIASPSRGQSGPYRRCY